MVQPGETNFYTSRHRTCRIGTGRSIFDIYRAHDHCPSEGLLKSRIKVLLSPSVLPPRLSQKSSRCSGPFPFLYLPSSPRLPRPSDLNTSSIPKLCKIYGLALETRKGKRKEKGECPKLENQRFFGNIRRIVRLFVPAHGTSAEPSSLRGKGKEHYTPTTSKELGLRQLTIYSHFPYIHTY